ncbi:50S ribosomal protein L11 methyltransferase [Alicyclobacillaceae bacterium I2511]|nr:50S ribosomal protein L11 methyltransferase [Alicyclobacillaceae bacterium I2511]
MDSRPGPLLMDGVIWVQWWEVRIGVAQESVEALTALLEEWPEVQGVVVEGGVMGQPLHPEYGEWLDESLMNPEPFFVVMYVPIHVEKWVLKDRLAQVFARLAAAGLAVDSSQENVFLNVLDEADWEQAWKGDYHPIAVGSQWFIMPRWEAGMLPTVASEGRIPLLLEPGMAFGTGTHETTQMCLEALSDRVKPGMRVMDVGCGSAVLAIAAAKLGATQVVALDIDPVAVGVAQENVDLNGVSEIVRVVQRDLLAGYEASEFDVMVANILRDPVLALIPEAAVRLRSEGKMIVSGFVESQRLAVESAFIAADMQVFNCRQRGSWVTLEAQKPAESNRA